MKRLIELVCALAATTIGLIGVVTEVRVIAYPYNNMQVGGPTAFGAHPWSVMSGQVDHYMILLAVLLVGLSIGAYLHAIYRSMWGLAILWISTISLIMAVVYVTLTPPSFNFTSGSINSVVMDVVPTAVSVLTVVLAVVSAMTAITPLRPASIRTSWVEPVLHLHSPA